MFERWFRRDSHLDEQPWPLRKKLLVGCCLVAAVAAVSATVLFQLGMVWTLVAALPLMAATYVVGWRSGIAAGAVTAGLLLLLLLLGSGGVEVLAAPNPLAALFIVLAGLYVGAQAETYFQMRRYSWQLAYERERLHQEAADRQRAERRYRAITELAADYAMVLHIDSSGEVAGVDWLKHNFTGGDAYSEAEMADSKTWYDLLLPEDVPRLLEARELALGGKPGEVTLRVFSKQGKALWLRCYYQPELRDDDGHVIRIYAAAQNITASKEDELALQDAREDLLLRVQERTAQLSETNAELMAQIAERERAEAELARERNLLRTVIDAIPDKLFVKDMDARFVIANLPTEVWANLPPGALIGKTDFDIYPPELAERFYRYDREVLDEGKALLDFETEDMLPAGETRWILVAKIPLRDEKGRVTGLVGLTRDITEQKMVEEALRRTHEELEARVVERTAELSRANDVLMEQIAVRVQTEEALLQAQAELKAQAESLTVLNTMANVLYRYLDFQTVIDRALNSIVALTGVSSAAFYVVDEAANELRFIQRAGSDVGTIEAVETLPLAGSLSGLAVRERALFVSPDVAQDDRLVSEVRQQLVLDGFKGVVSVPVLFQERVWGVVNLFFRSEHQLSPQERQTFQAIGRTIGIALANARHVEQIEAEIKERIRAEEALQFRVDFENLITAISTEFINLTPDEVDDGIHAALQLIGQFSGMDHAFIALVQDDCWSMAYEWTTDVAEPELGALQTTCDDNFLWWAELLNGLDGAFFPQLEHAPPALAPGRDALLARGVKSLFYIPMMYLGQVIGILGFEAVRREVEWPQETTLLLRIVGEILVNALEHKRAGKALRDSETRFRTVVESLGEGLVITDRDDRISYVNSRLCQLTGYAHDALLGQPAYRMLIPARYWDEMAGHHAQRLSGETGQYEVLALHKDGHEFWIEVHATPFRSPEGEIIGTLAAITDISDRRSAEAALRESEDRYRRLFETSPDAIMVLTGGQITYVNPAGVVLLAAASADDLLSQPVVNFVPEPSREPAARIIAALAGGQVIPAPFDGQFVTLDGRVVDVEVTGSAIAMSGQAAVQLVVRDVTERKRVQLALNQVVQGTSGETGQAFFHSLVHNIAHSLDVKFAFISALEAEHHEPPRRARVIASDTRSAHLPGDYVYALAGMPSNSVLNAGWFCVADGFPAVFPQDTDLIALGVRSYAGVVLYDYAEQPLGFLAVMDDKPMADVEMVERLLRIFATRASAELQRAQMETALRNSEEKYRSLIEHSRDAIYVIAAEEQHFAFVNAGFVEIFGYSAEEVTSPEFNFLTLVAPESQPHVIGRERMLVAGQMPEEMLEFVALDKYGNRLEVEISVSYINYEGKLATQGIVRDVTERKRAEEQLAASEERYRAVSELTTDYAYAIQFDERGQFAFEWVTEAFYRITGYLQEEISGPDGWRKFIYPEDAAIVEHMHRALLNGETDQQEYRICTQDGRVRWLRDQARPVKDETGMRVLRAFGAAQDITEQLLAEQAEREQRTLAEALRDSAQMLNRSLDLDRVLDYIMEAVQRVVPHDASVLMLRSEGEMVVARSRGYPEGQLDIINAMGRELVELRTIKTMFETGAPLLIPDTTQHTYWQTIEGTTWVKSYLGTPVHVDEEPIGVLHLDSTEPNWFTPAHAGSLSAFADLVGLAIKNARLFDAVREYAGELQRRVAERTAEIQEQHRRITAIMDSLADAVIVTGLDGGIILANPVAEVLLGAAPSEARLGERINDVVARLVAQEAQTHTEVLEVGSTVFQAKAAKVRLGSQEMGTVIVLRDVTRYQELDNLKTQFVNTVSHELRTPLANVKLYLSLLRKGRPERHGDYIEVIDRETARLNRLINDLLDLSRLEEAKAQTRRAHEWLDVHSLVEQVIENHMAQAAYKHIALTYQVDPAYRPRLFAHRDQMMQLFTNLIGNAVAYTLDGGTVTIRVAPVEMPEFPGESALQIEVSDTGIGIPAKELDFIFDRFYRGENTENGSIPGTGLGLAITKEIVDLHYGRIEVESEIDQGSVFRVYLPLNHRTVVRESFSV